MRPLPRFGRRGLLLLLLLVPLLPGLLAHAQPYAAAGGFDRPQRLDGSAAAASVAVAVSPKGEIATVWAGRLGVWLSLQDSPGETSVTELVAEEADVRSVSAAYLSAAALGAPGEEALVITWVSRDRRTGVYHYRALINGRISELFEDALIVELTLVEVRGTAVAAGLFRQGGEGQLRLVPLLGGEGRVLYRTPLTQRSLSVARQDAEGLWFSWVEGRNEQGEFGLISEWDAMLAYLDESGTAAPLTVNPVSLGEANVEDERQGVALLADPATGASRVTTLWPGEEGTLRMTVAERVGGELKLSEAREQFGAGRPLGGQWPYFYYVTGASLRRLNPASGEILNVAWSPVTIEGAALAAGRTAPNGRSLTAAAWYGRAQGGAVEVHATNDRQAVELTLTDRFAALMRVNPWVIWDELFGQLLAALIVGMLVGFLLVPLLMLVGPLVAAAPRSAAGGGPQVTAIVAGLTMGVLPAVAAAALLAKASGETGPRELGILAAAVLIGALTGWLVGRGGDREAQGTLTVAGAATAFVAVSLWAFLSYSGWAPLLGLA